MARLLLIRHGTTRLHKNDRFWGWTDVPLSSTGIKQAGKLRNRLSGEKITTVYTSTLSRASDTAEIIAAGHKAKLTALDELCECNFGFIEGLTFKEIEHQFPELAEELASWKTVSFPGGETLDQLNERVRSFVKTLEDLKAKDTVAIVSHGGTLRLLICNLLGVDIQHWQQFRIDRASLSIIETYPQTAILLSLNDVTHLKK
ncbi:MAG: alpha-ribazole phosphatase [Dehalococcoidales bacterium]|nr:alpha-ribazole phosphatase [Dehalococcoidales bacterium]